MKRTFAQYEHSTIGFPRVVLKWTEENGEWQPPYVTIHGVIKPDLYGWERYTRPQNNPEHALARFDDWVRKRFSEDASVQG